MKTILLTSFLILLHIHAWTDIAPNPIEAKGIMPHRPCKIQMVKEVVNVQVNYDSAITECTFWLENHGGKIILPIGFPVMNFFHHQLRHGYQQGDKDRFSIEVDGIKLTREHIGVPKEMQDVYKQFMKAENAWAEAQRRIDNLSKQYHFTAADYYKYYDKRNEIKNDTLLAYINAYETLPSPDNFSPKNELYDRLSRYLDEGKYPWYVWNVTFMPKEKKVIKVSYKLPSGETYMHRGPNGDRPKLPDRYFKYLLSTGGGWEGPIKEAKVNIKLDEIDLEDIKEILPKGFHLDTLSKSLSWDLVNLEPTEADDIAFHYQDRKRYNERHEFVQRGDHKAEMDLGDYVIAGVFNDEKSARESSERLKKSGFSELEYGYLSNRARWYTHIMADDIEEAKRKRNEYRKIKTFKGVWLLTVHQ